MANNRDSEVTFDDVLDELGITRCVFPRGKFVCKVSCEDEGCGCFRDKLREFVDYQIPQSFMEPKFDLGIALSSPEGKAIFKEALQADFMECYYTIGQYIEHQSENACSSVAVVAALNSLAIDPGYGTWYEQFRWHHQGSLSCASCPLQSSNFTLHQVCCLSVCNDTLAFPVQIEDDWTVEQLRAWVKLTTSRSDVVMVANFGRDIINQIGVGHFGPLAGYHEEKDLVLQIDTAKHKYGAHWLPLQHLLRAMNDRDYARNENGFHRGFAILTRPDYEPGDRLFAPSLLLRLDDFRGRVKPGLKSFMAKWNKWLDTSISDSSSTTGVLRATIHTLIAAMRHESDPKFKLSLMTLTPVHFRSNHQGKSSIIARCRKPHNPSCCPNYFFCKQLESLDIFKQIQTCMALLGSDDRRQILDLVVCDLENIDQAIAYTKSDRNVRKGMMKTLVAFLKTEKPNNANVNNVSTLLTSQNGKTESCECPGYVEFDPEHILTFLLLSWPFNEMDMTTHSTFRDYILRDAVFDSTHSSDDHATFRVISDAFRTLKNNVDMGPNDGDCQNMDPNEAENSAPVVQVKKFKTNDNTHSMNDGSCDFLEHCGVEKCNVTVRDALDRIMKRQVLHSLSNTKHFNLKDHVKAMKRKLNITLQYHRLK